MLAQQNIPLGKSNSAVGGGQIGYNRQFASGFLVGLEVDFSVPNLRGSGIVGPLQGDPPRKVLNSFGQASREID
jgi:hypothetical protein